MQNVLTPLAGLASRIGEFGRWRRLGLAFFAGLLITAGHPPVSVPWALFIAMPLLCWALMAARTPWAAAWTGWAAGFGFFFSVLHWIGHAFLVEPDKFLVLLPFAVTGMPAGLAIFWGAASALAWVLWRRGAAIWLTLPVALAFAELLRSYVLTGFPWALPAYVWLDTPVAQAAAWAGPQGLTLLTLTIAATPLVALSLHRLLPAALALFGLGLLWVVGAAGMAHGPLPADAPVIRLVQPNAPQHLKWQPAHRETFYARLLSATAAEYDPSLGAPDIVIWPEMAVTFVPAEHPAEMTRIAQAARGAPVILGAFHRDPDDVTRVSNALHTVLADGTLGPRYDKHHLVPFGEYLPFAWLFDSLGIETIAGRGTFARGGGPQTLTIPGVPAFSPIICYEAIFPYEAVGSDRPRWIVQITNDAWFGSYAGPQQHLAQARFRAIEQGLPVVRATNTGISAIIDAQGLMVVKIPMHNYKYVDARLPADFPPTLYSIIGDIPAAFAIVFLLFSLIFKSIIMRNH